MEFWDSLWLEILSSLCTSIFFIAVTLFGSSVWISFRRRDLQKFFGVSNARKLTIYLSNIHVTMFGSIGINGKKRSFSGETISYGEIQVANQIRDLFTFIIPKLEEILKPIGKSLLSDTDVQIAISPRVQNEVEKQEPYIAIGSPVFNAASSYIELFCKSKAKIESGPQTKSEIESNYYMGQYPVSTSSATDTNSYDPNTGLAMPSIPYSGGTVNYLEQPSETSKYTNSQPLPSGTHSAFNYDSPKFAQSNEVPNKKPSISVDGLPPIVDTNYGFIERVKDPESDRMLFYVAGISEFGTMGAVHYLATRWNVLHKKYKDDKPFWVMLRFDPSDYKQAYEVF